MPPGLAHGEEDARALAVPVVVEVSAVLPGESVWRASRPRSRRRRRRPSAWPGTTPARSSCTIPSRTSNRRVSGACTRWSSCPKPGISVATPHSTGRTSRISATSESPGSAPRTATGPVALLIRPRSISVTRSSSLRIWPEKQSFVSNVTTSPGSTSSTGSQVGAERPDHLITRKPVPCHSSLVSVAGRTIGASDLSRRSRRVVLKHRWLEPTPMEQVTRPAPRRPVPVVRRRAAQPPP